LAEETKAENTAIKVVVCPAGTVQSASTRYRVCQFLAPLRDQGMRIQVAPYPVQATPVRRLAYFGRLIRLARWADVIWIQKRRFPRFLPLLAKINSRIVYDFDDALFVGASSEWLKGSTKPDFARDARFDALLKQCRHVIAGNDYLASYARRVNPQVTVIPTVVDLARYPLSPAHGTVRSPITLGWVGNGENLVYLQDLEQVFVRLRERFGDRIRLHVISDRAPQLPADVPLVFQPWRLETEVEDLYAFDIGLMPLRDDPLARGKCAFKAVQYMALGIPAVVSPVGANKELVEHQVNGLLATSHAEWLECLTALIQDRELGQRLGLAGRETIAERFSLDAAVPAMALVLRTAANG
jgi:glycosyltransferase involved in cell wall biosynthesis